MQTVETVEKVPFQKLFLKSGKEPLKKRQFFRLPHNIFAIFEPVVGDFFDDFSDKRFFDSLVGLSKSNNQRMPKTQMKIKRFPFLMKWIATIVIFMVFLGFAGNFFMVNLFMFGSSSNDPNRYYVAIVFGLVTGFGISIAQVAVAGKVLSQKYRLLWVLAGVVGFLVGFSLMVSLFSAAKHYQNVPTTFLIAAFISGGTSGLVTGILQWLSLKDTYQLAYRWILANVIAGIISYLARWSWLIFLHDHLVVGQS